MNILVELAGTKDFLAMFFITIIFLFRSTGHRASRTVNGRAS